MKLSWLFRTYREKDIKRHKAKEKTPFFVTQTFTREDGKWWLTAMVFTTRTSGPGIEPGQNMNH